MDEPSATESVDGVLENLVGSLPVVDFEAEDSSDEDLNYSENGSGSVSVFSRSQHLEMLGIYDTEAELHKKNDEEEEINILVPSKQEHSAKRTDERDVIMERTTTESKEVTKECAVDHVEIDWNKFKEEFSATLQTSQEKLSMEQSNEVHIAGDLSREVVHEQLLINAIAMMHSTGVEAEQIDPSATSQSSSNLSINGSSVTHKARDMSPLRQRKHLLSQGTLETIHESEIDKVLEMSDLPQQRDDGMKEKHRDGPPLPKFVWDGEDKQDNKLMMELEQLSLSQSAKSPGDGHNDVTSNQAGHPQSSGQVSSTNKNDQPTVFLDLRQSGPLSNSHNNHSEENGVHNLSSTAQRLLALRGGTCERQSRSSSESEDSDDPYAWISQRKQMKDTGQPVAVSPRHNLHQFHKKTPKSSANHVHAREEHTRVKSNLSAPVKCETDPNHLQQFQESNIKTSMPIHSHDQDRPSDGTKTTVLASKEEGATKSAGVLHVSSSSSLSEEETRAATSVIKIPPAKVNGIEAHRQRSTDSLTLSSSFSENESLIQENGKEKHIEMHTNTTQPPAASSPVTSKKAQKRKLKKARKKEKAKEVNKHKKRSQRNRIDSLTTSSDEEHSSSGLEIVSSTSTEKSIEDSGEVIIDEEALKLHLLKRIQSKKPPSHFVTPATEPVFHEGVTFEHQCLCTDPTASTDAMLVLSLSEYGLTTLQDVECNLDFESRIALHLVVLTWLCHAACFNEHTVSCHENGEVLSTKKGVSRPPFLVTGLQLTIFDGHPAILVGVAYDTTADKKNGSPVKHELRTAAAFQHLENYIQATPSSSLLNEITSNDFIQKMLTPSVLKQLNFLFGKPLASIFTLLDDPTPLTTPVSFYWHSGYHPSCLPTDESVKSSAAIATTICTLGRTSLQSVELVFTVLHSIYYNGFDLAGLRLIYGEVNNCSDVLSTITLEQKNRKDLLSLMTLALAIRGPDAVYRWMDVVGPKDTNLAKVTDPDSLNARFDSATTDELHCLRTPYTTSAILAKWFGGRACLKTGSLLGISDAHTKRERKKRQRVRFSESESDDTPPSPLPVDAAFPPLVTNRPRLVTQAYSKLLLVVSPHIPPFLYSSVLESCSKLGYDIYGVKRIRLNSKRATALNISGSFVFHFAPSSTPPSPAVIDSVLHPLSLTNYSVHNSPPLPSILLVIGRENALVHSVALKKEMSRNLASMVVRNPQLTVIYNLSYIVDCPENLLHVTDYVEEQLVKVVGSFSTSLTVNSSQPKLEFGWDRGDTLQDELCFVAVPHSLSLTRALDFLNKVFTLKHGSETDSSGLLRSGDSATEGESGPTQYELLGFKVVPQLTRFYAKRLCPISPDDGLYQQAIQQLSDGPATLMIFRGISCNKRILNILSNSPKPVLHTGALEQRLQVIVSQDFQEAYTLSSIFFTDRELFCDTPNWALAPFVPHTWLQDSDILQRMQQASLEQLFAVLNISMLKLKLVVKVLDKLSRSGFKFVAMRLAEPLDEESVVCDQTHEDDVRIVVCVQRENAVWHLQHVLKPFHEVTRGSALFTCSAGFLDAISDTKQYFPDGLCCQPTTTAKEYNIKCDSTDNFDQLLSPAACKLATKPGFLGYVSPLLETTIMICPPCLIASETKLTTAGFIEVLDFLSQAKFAICGLKMVMLSEEISQALHHHCELLGTKVEDLTCGSSVVMVLQRDNAASCCQDIFRSTLLTCYHGNRADHVNKLLTSVIVPKTAKQAKEVLDIFKVSPL